MREGSRSRPRPAPAADADGADRTLPTVDERGQTVQDFAIGTSVFLLTIAFVFAFVPTLFTPFESEVAPGLESQADRVADAMVANGSVDGRPNHLTARGVQKAIRPDPDGDDSGYGTEEALQQRYGLPETSQINVTVTPMPPDESGADDFITAPSGFLSGLEPGLDDQLAAGDTYRGQPAATVSRIVVVEGVPECDPDDPSDPGQACRLTVRVW